MKPALSDSGFGSITVDGSTINHDIIIRLSAEVEKRKKNLSKTVYGTTYLIISMFIYPMYVADILRD